MGNYTEQEVAVLRAKSYGRFARPVIRMAAVIAEELRRAGWDEWSVLEEALWRAREIDTEVTDRERVYLDFIDCAARDRSEMANDLRYRYARWTLAPYDEVMSRKRTRKVVLP